METNINRIEAVILAAGVGKRIQKPGQVKALLSIGNKPMICWVIDALIKCNINKIWIVKFYSDDFSIIDEIYKSSEVTIEYINDFKRLGSLYSFSIINTYVSDSFICVDCDLFIETNSFCKMIHEGIDKVSDTDCIGVMALVTSPSREDSNMLLIKDKYVTRFIKNGSEECMRGGYVYIWKKQIFNYISMFFEQNCFSLSQYYDFIATNKLIDTMLINDLWDIDTPSDVEVANSILESRIGKK